MVMGIQGTQDFLLENPDLGLEIYLIYDNEGQLYTGMSQGLENILEEVN